MFRLVKQVFIVLLSFRRSLATKCVSFNNEPCMIRPTLVDLNRVDLKYYPFIISLDKRTGSCKSVDETSTRICVSSKTKDVNGKVFNIVTNKNEDKTMVNHILCDRKWKFNSTTCNSNQKWNHETC